MILTLLKGQARSFDFAGNSSTISQSKACAEHSEADGLLA
jgi:hypothetical protein